MQNINSTIVSQYANDPVLVRLIESFNAAIDPAPDFDLFYKQIWDIYTATGLGLDIWGRIVDVSRVLTLTSVPDSFGFYTGAAGDYEPFGQAPFSAGGTVTANYTLADEVYRKLILVKAAANISACTIPVMNGLLTNLFGTSGRVWVNTVGPMMMRLTFECYLSDTDLAILLQSGAIPRPTGVRTFLLQDPVGASFGFAEMGDLDSAPFGQCPFLSDTTLDHIAPLTSSGPTAPTAPLDAFQLDMDALA